MPVNSARLLRWSQTVIDLAEGDPAKGAGFGFGSPLAAAVAFRGLARWWLGRPGWRQDLHDAVAMARNSDPVTLASVVAWTYSFAIQYGVLRADDSAVRAIEEAVQTAEGSSNDAALSVAKYALGVALLNRDAAADRHRGLELMGQARDIWLRELVLHGPGRRVVGRPGKARRGDRDAAIAMMRKAVRRSAPGRTARVWHLGHQRSGGDAAGAWHRGRPGGSPRDDRPVGEPAGRPRFGDLEIMLLRLRALLARAHGDDMRTETWAATAHGGIAWLEGHIAWAEDML